MNDQIDSEVPLDFICPLTNQIMKNPYLMDDGITYEKNDIEEYLNENDCISPIANIRISKKGTPNTELLQRIKDHFNKTIKIIVTKLEGGVLEFDMKTTDTIIQLKKKIEEKVNMKVECQKLIYGKNFLTCDCSTLENYSIEDKSTIHMVFRHTGG